MEEREMEDLDLRDREESAEEEAPEVEGHRRSISDEEEGPGRRSMGQEDEEGDDFDKGRRS
jgi:hypothetical protein